MRPSCCCDEANCPRSFCYHFGKRRGPPRAVHSLIAATPGEKLPWNSGVAGVRSAPWLTGITLASKPMTGGDLERTERKPIKPSNSWQGRRPVHPLGVGKTPPAEPLTAVHAESQLSIPGASLHKELGLLLRAAGLSHEFRHCIPVQRVRHLASTLAPLRRFHLGTAAARTIPPNAARSTPARG